MYKIKTPNSHYNGITYGVEFVNGIGETVDEEVKNILVNDYGYEEVKPKNETSKQRKQSPVKEGE